MYEYRNFFCTKFLILVTRLPLYETNHTIYFLIRYYCLAWSCLLIFISLYSFLIPLTCLLTNLPFFLSLNFEPILSLIISFSFVELAMLRTLALLVKSLVLLKLVLMTKIKKLLLMIGMKINLIIWVVKSQTKHFFFYGNHRVLLWRVFKIL